MAGAAAAVVFLLLLHLPARPASSAVHEIRRGFSVTHDSSYTEFQPLLADPTGVFSLGFLRVDSSQLDLAVLHLPSTTALWRAPAAQPLLWAASASLSFNGSLVLSDSAAGVLWSTSTDAGDRVVLLNSSNLQVQKPTADADSVLWQSFDFPADTLVQDQNFSSTAALFSRNRRFSMRLGANYLALFMELGGGTAPVLYWKHSALEAKAQIVPGEGAVYVRVDLHGFLGMYQTEAAPIEVFPFDSFGRGIAAGLRRFTLESDGNLRAYYWNGSIWVRDLQAIAERCEIPTACGAYGICNSVTDGCGCLDGSVEEGCLPAASGDLCAADGEFRVLRRKGVDLANRELAAFHKVASLEECEGSCKQNCSCWGAIYNNASGFCYRLDYPIQTLVEGDARKEGYFKVRTSSGSGGGGGGRKRARAAFLSVGCAVFVGATVFGAYSVCRRQRRRMRAGEDGSMGEGLAPGPYKYLSSASFRSVELSNSFSDRK